MKNVNFNEYGNLNGGIIKGLSLNDVETYFVKNFPKSKTRERNFKGLEGFLDELKRNDILEKISKIWLDGSFLTNKLDPNDIDMVLYFNPKLKDLPFINNFLKNETKQIHIIGKQFFCDAYFSIDDTLIPNEETDAKRHFNYQSRYWMGQFGFDREEHNKGIIEVNF